MYWLAIEKYECDGDGGKVDDGLLGWYVWKRKEDGRKSVVIGIGW